jgi:sRNA-binding carbon storage regulator CsrA
MPVAIEARSSGIGVEPPKGIAMMRQETEAAASQDAASLVVVSGGSSIDRDPTG